MGSCNSTTIAERNMKNIMERISNHQPLDMLTLQDIHSLPLILNRHNFLKICNQMTSNVNLQSLRLILSQIHKIGENLDWTIDPQKLSSILFKKSQKNMDLELLETLQLLRSFDWLYPHVGNFGVLFQKGLIKSAEFIFESFPNSYLGLVGSALSSGISINILDRFISRPVTKLQLNSLVDWVVSGSSLDQHVDITTIDFLLDLFESDNSSRFVISSELISRCSMPNQLILRNINLQRQIDFLEKKINKSKTPQ